MDTIDEGKSNRHVAVTSKYHFQFPLSVLSICFWYTFKEGTNRELNPSGF